MRNNGSTRVPRRGRGDRRFPVIVKFARGSATPHVDSLLAVYRCGGWLAKRPPERVTVVGHANKRGLDKPAVALARARVAAVAKLLRLLGAAREQVVSVSAPRLHTIPLDSTPEHRVRHRVVVIFRHEPPDRGQKARAPLSGGAARSRSSRRRSALA